MNGIRTHGERKSERARIEIRTGCGRAFPVLFVAALFAVPLFASEESNRLDTARENYRQGLFEEAVAELSVLVDSLEGDDQVSAYEYLARSHVRLDEEAKGKDTFRKLLRIRPDWSPDAAAVTDQEMAAFEMALDEYKSEGRGAINVRSDPAGANLFLDGVRQEEPTPCTIESVPAGEHALRIELEGYLSMDTTVSVLPEEIAEIGLDLAEGEPGEQKSFWMNKWVMGAGGVLGLGLILAIAGGGGGDSDGGGGGAGDLPYFPDPPKR